MEGGVESPQGIDTPGVEEFPRGDVTSGLPTEGEGVPGEEERGRGGDIANATSKDVAAAGAGGRHGAGRGESARGAGQQENPAGDSSGVVNKEGGHEASRVE